MGCVSVIGDALSFGGPDLDPKTPDPEVAKIEMRVGDR